MIESLDVVARATLWTCVDFLTMEAATFVDCRTLMKSDLDSWFRGPALMRMSVSPGVDGRVERVAIMLASWKKAVVSSSIDLAFEVDGAMVDLLVRPSLKPEASYPSRTSLSLSCLMKPFGHDDVSH